MRLVDVGSSKIRLKAQTEVVVLVCSFHNVFVALFAASYGFVFRYLIF